MRRRTLLRFMAGIAGVLPIAAWRAWGQGVVFPGQQGHTLRQLAALVLPSVLGTDGVEKIASGFERYVREYRAGADTDHGYGFTHVRPKPPSPASKYMDQLEALPRPLDRAAIIRVLESAEIKDLPRVPEGKNVIADLMSFYFRSSDANDLCYDSEIGRDNCRGLKGSDNPPRPLGRPA